MNKNFYKSLGFFDYWITCQVILVILKLTDVLQWSWMIILIPALITAALTGMLLIFMLMVYISDKRAEGRDDLYDA